MASKKKWSDFTDTQKAAILLAASVELSLTATALADLVRRPREQVRGPKALWLLGSFVQPVGPIACLACGRTKT
jgi:hypothetical protein